MAEQQNQNKNANAKEQDIHQLLKVRREKLAELQTEGKDPFQITKYDQDTHSADIKDNYAEYDGKEVSIAGRIMSKRVMGKASFCNVQDLKGNIQCYVSRDELGDDSYKDFKKMEFKAGVVEGNFFDKDGIQTIADIPSRDVLLAKFLGSIQSPVSKAVRTFQAIADAKAE